MKRTTSKNMKHKLEQLITKNMFKHVGSKLPYWVVGDDMRLQVCLIIEKKENLKIPCISGSRGTDSLLPLLKGSGS